MSIFDEINNATGAFIEAHGITPNFLRIGSRKFEDLVRESKPFRDHAFQHLINGKQIELLGLRVFRDHEAPHDLSIGLELSTTKKTWQQ